jgi:hypothetical protein
MNINLRIVLAPEMNGAWVPWAVGNCGNTASDFVGFWKYVVDKFRREKAPVVWIWSPNVRHWGETTTFASVYPGDDYVDFLGIEGYNWGSSQSWSVWQSFKEVFLTSYNDLIGLSKKNIIITEMASTEIGGNKAQWILDMFTDLKSTFPQISAITWFNMNKETDWRINSSIASENAFKEGVRKFFMSDNPIVSINQPLTTKTNQSNLQKINKPIFVQESVSNSQESINQENESKKSDDAFYSNSNSEIDTANQSKSTNQSHALFFIIWIGLIMTLLPITIWLAVK